MTLEVEREEVVQSLCAHYAQDHLSTGELEQRFERVYQSANRAQLMTVLDGLPAIRGTLAAHTAAHGPLYEVAEPSTGLAPDEKRYVAVFSEVKKEGHWLAARRMAVRAVFGGVVLDFREAAIPAEGIEMDVDVIFGEAKILLPPGIGADVDCTAVLGSAEDKTRPGLPGAPLIRVRGGCVFGSIIVQTKLPKPARMESWRKQLKSFFGGDDDLSADPRY